MKNLLTFTILLFTSLQMAAQVAMIPGDETIKLQPILHSTMAIFYDGKVIYTDPYGGKEAFKGVPPADLVLITDIHGDHMNTNTLNELGLQSTLIIAPKAVADLLPSDFKNVFVLGNGEKATKLGIAVEAVPMYNLPESDDSRHTKGRGNGYILTLNGKRIYISGDTEDIAEMRALKNIEVAFVCMNQPYTMTVEAAADAVLEFKPNIVYPFHYRGSGGFSDVEKFKTLVNANPKINVQLISWYPED